jgi:hypothetical protein
MGQHTPEDSPELFPPVSVGPSLGSAAALGALILILLLANGRPIGGGAPPSTLLSILTAPVFFLARGLVVLDGTGTALAGKVAASLLSALAAATLFLAVGRRHPEQDARTTALVFAFGTTVWATSQALYPQPAAVLFLSLVVLCLLKAEDTPAWAGRAGLPLGLAAAADPGATALAAVLFLGLAARWPRRSPFLLLWTLPGAALLLLGEPASTAGQARTSVLEPGLGGLLVSPAQGLLVFTPVVVVAAVGLVRAFARGERWLAVTLGVGFVAHWLSVGLSPGGPSEGWGPCSLTPALPLLFLLLPEGIAVLGKVGPVLAALSIAVQALGAFSYDHRWDRLNEPFGSALIWDPARSPIVFQVRERVIRPALPAIKDGRALLCEHAVVLFGPEGSRVTFAGEDIQVTGAEPLLGDVHAQAGAQVQEGRLKLRSPGDALFVRVRANARARRFELRIAGRGRGTLVIAERTFWSAAPREASYPTDGAFKLRHRYYYPESGGDDVTLGLRTAGSFELQSVALVSPGEPENVIRLP